MFLVPGRLGGLSVRLVYFNDFAGFLTFEVAFGDAFLGEFGFIWVFVSNMFMSAAESRLKSGCV